MTGFASIEFAIVLSPLAPKQNMEKFLAGIKADAGTIGDGMNSQFTPIGKRSLKEGETRSLSVGRSKIEYERVVE